MKTTKHFILVVLFNCLLINAALSQDYLITAKGDSLTGRVRVYSAGLEQRAMVVAADKKKTSLSIFQVKRLSMDSEIYEPVKTQSGYVFMKLLKPGYLSLYAFQMPNQNSFDGLFLQKKDASSLEVPNLNFKKMMIKFLGDCEDVADSIETDWNRRDLHKIVDAYNACIDARTTSMKNAVSTERLQQEKKNSWDALAEKIRSKPDFEGKADALDMITDIKGKIERGEKVPKFLVDGLKSSLANADVSAELEQALSQIESK